MGGTCEGCGGEGQPCCGTTCGSGLTCQSGSCTPCGARGQICCTDPTVFPYPCEEPNSCVGGTCVACGYSGEICCDPASCGTGYMCDEGSNMCVPRTSD
jgi:hypothetical protein